MDSNTLDASMKGIKSIWGPLSTEVVAACRKHLEDCQRLEAVAPSARCPRGFDAAVPALAQIQSR